MASYNGKSLEQVLNELREPAEAKPELLYDKYPYYSKDVYEGRLDKVLGRSHFFAEYANVQTVHLSQTQVMLECHCTIHFIDDDGNKSYCAQGVGTFELTYSDKGATFQWINNAGYRVQIQAFKSACKSLALFGEKEKAACSATPKDPNHTKKKSTATERNEEFITNGEIIMFKTDSRTNKPVYKVEAYRVVGEVMEDKPSAIVFYPNMYKNCADAMNRAVMTCADGKQHKLQLKVTVADYEADERTQYIFRGFGR